MIIVFYGYNRLPQGISIIKEIKNRMNNFRLTTNSKFNLVKPENFVSINTRVKDLFAIPAPYDIKDGIRYLRGTNKLVYEKLSVIAIDKIGKKHYYTSISECSKALGFGRRTIKNCLLTSKIHKSYQFIYNIK